MGKIYRDSSIYRSPQLYYNGNSTSTQTSFEARARISVSQTPSIEFRARIRSLSILSSHSRISTHNTATLELQARIRALSTLTSQARISNCKTGTLVFRSCIQKTISRNLELQARLSTSNLFTLEIRANLIRLRTLSMLASIKKVPKYDDLSLTYNALNRVYGGQLKIVPRITMRANIATTILRTLASKARLFIGSNLEVRGRVSQRQGWPIPNSYDEQMNVFTDTSLYIKTSISEALQYKNDLGIRSRIHPTRITTLNSRARLIAGQSMQLKAKITAWRTYIHLPCSYTIQSVVNKRLRMVFYSMGTHQTMEIGVRARVIQKKRIKFTGHFIISMPKIVGQVITFDIDNCLSEGHLNNQILGSKASITRTY